MKEDQEQIFHGRKSMECPICRATVAFDGFAVTRVESLREPAKREVLKAARWARVQNKSLADYLQTREGRVYQAFWSESEIEAADKQVTEEEG